MNKIKFFIINLLKKIIVKFLRLFIRRNNRYYMFYAKMFKSGKIYEDVFLHNTKYLFLYLTNKKEKILHITWLCDDETIRSNLKKHGYNNIYSQKSLKGIYYALRSKYWFYDFDPYTIKTHLIDGATLINCWHGIPLKKIAKDNNEYPIRPFIEQKIYDFFKKKTDYYITNGEFDSSCFKTALSAEEKSLITLGSPRLDVLFKDFQNAEMFMEKDFINIKSMYEQGKKLFIYMPTFRDTGKNISSWLKSDRLRQFLCVNNAILICKLHPIDKNSLNFELGKEFYKMDSKSDVYPILKYTQSLITDYSSIYYDYLLLDKSIIYYVPDLIEYQEKCHGFYRPYEELTAGIKTYNEDELINAMQNVVNGVDNYKGQREKLRDKMFKYQDGRNCERVVEWIRSLDK